LKIDKKSFLYGFGICTLMVFIFLSIPMVESAIPPTRAIQNIHVISSNWAADLGWINAT